MAQLEVTFMGEDAFELPENTLMQKWMEVAIERDTTLSVLFVEEEEGRDYNNRYRGKDYATNVLTFDYQHEPVAVADLVICVPVLVREAQEQEKSFNEHLAHLLIHGVLHAHGYDHMTDDEADVMEGKEIVALKKVGFANPYADRVLIEE